MGWGNEQPLVQLKRDAADRKRLAAENDRLRAELAGVRVELERTEGDWAVAIREATRVRAALARVEATLRAVESGDYGTSAGPGYIANLVRAALSVAATDTEETP